MKSKRYLVGIRVLLIISVLVSGPVPLRAQAASPAPANDPPYVIRGHAYVTGTTNGLADVGIRLHFTACDDGEPHPRVVDLPSTGVLGSWACGRTAV